MKTHEKMEQYAKCSQNHKVLSLLYKRSVVPHQPHGVSRKWYN